jgi:hypothetical protein
VQRQIHSFFKVPVLAAGAIVVLAGSASAQTNVSLPDTSQTTVLTATVSEQARVTFPSAVAFTVNDITGATAASPATVAITNIVLATATKQLKVSVQAETAGFSAPAPGGSTTWSATDVSWNAATWSSATGAAGSLSNSAYTAVGTCAADAANCSTTGLVFTLGAKAGVQRSGSHTLTVRWKVEAIGS